MLDEAKRDGLLPLHDAELPTWVSSGVGERAKPIAARVARARAFLSELLGVVPEVQLLVLVEADWAGRAAHPIYGMPNSDRGTLCVAGEPNDFWVGPVARGLDTRCGRSHGHINTAHLREILDRMARGHDNGRIARDLSLSAKTVANYASTIFSKIQVADRMQAVLQAREAGLGRD